MPEEIIKKALERDPGNPFVLSCQDYFLRTGGLSPKQISALERVTPTRPKMNKYERAYHNLPLGDDCIRGGKIMGDFPPRGSGWDYANSNDLDDYGWD